MKKVTTRIQPFTTSPNRSRPATFSEDMDTRLSEENSRINQMNSMSDQMNELSSELNANTATVTQKHQAVIDAANYVSNAKTAVTNNTATVNSKANQVATQAQQVSQNLQASNAAKEAAEEFKTQTKTYRDEVIQKAGQVSANTTTVTQKLKDVEDAAYFIGDKQNEVAQNTATVNAKANQVATQAQQVEQNLQASNAAKEATEEFKTQAKTYRDEALEKATEINTIVTAATNNFISDESETSTTVYSSQKTEDLLSKKADLTQQGKLRKNQLPSLDKDDVGLGNVPNYPATSSLTDNSSDKFATARAIKKLNDAKAQSNHNHDNSYLSLSSYLTDNQYRTIDFNSLIQSGVFHININESSNTPPSHDNGLLQVFRYTDDWVVQRYSDWHGNEWTRAKLSPLGKNPYWSTWRRSKNTTEGNGDNILLNGSFMINQRGASSYTGDNSYLVGYDRWRVRPGTIVGVSPSGVFTRWLRVRTTSNNTNYPGIQQEIYDDLQKLRGQELCFSCNLYVHDEINKPLANGYIHVGLRRRDNHEFKHLSFVRALGDLLPTNKGGKISFPFRVPDVDLEPYYFSVFIIGKREENHLIDFNVTNIKLEYGKYPTMWIEPHYGDELRRCQRYLYIRRVPLFCYRWLTDINNRWSVSDVEFPVILRKTPNVILEKNSDTWSNEPVVSNLNQHGCTIQGSSLSNKGGIINKIIASAEYL